MYHCCPLFQYFSELQGRTKNNIDKKRIKDSVVIKRSWTGDCNVTSDFYSTLPLQNKANEIILPYSFHTFHGVLLVLPPIITFSQGHVLTCWGGPIFFLFTFTFQSVACDITLINRVKNFSLLNLRTKTNQIYLF